MERGLLKKTFVLIFLALLLYATFLVTNSLAALADAAYSLVDALYVFSLWLSLLLVKRGLARTAMRLVAASLFILSFLVMFSVALLLYSSFLFLPNHVVERPEILIASEILYILVLFYVYISLREEAVEEDIRALLTVSRDVERNILASFVVILAGLFSMMGLYNMDLVTAFLISAYVLYRATLFSYHAFRSIFGLSDPALVDAVTYKITSSGARLLSLELYGMGPYYYVEAVVDASHLPDPWDKVEELLKRRIESVVPSTVRVVIKSPGGGI